MILARVVGTVVATRKDPRLEGKKLLIVKPVSPEGKDEAGYVVAVDTVSAGYKERVIAFRAVPRAWRKAARIRLSIWPLWALSTMSGWMNKGTPCIWEKSSAASGPR